MRRAFFIAVFSACLVLPQIGNSQSKVFLVKGNVLDRKGNPLGYALVYLKETRSRILRMKRAGRDGRFTFTVLNAELDYEIYAERDDLSSQKVLISGSQKAPEVVVTLKLSSNN